jgi:hypothetical protein
MRRVFLTEVELVRSHLKVFSNAGMRPHADDHHGDTIYICPDCMQEF